MSGSKEKRLLHMQIHSAQNLLGVDKGGTSDPYVLASLVQRGTGKSVGGNSEKHRTATVPKCCNPEWANEKFAFGDGAADLDVPDEALPLVKFEVFDSNTFTSVDLGAVVVSVSDLLSKVRDGTVKNGEPQDYALEVVNKMKSVSGSIRVSLYFNRERTGRTASTAVDYNSPPLQLPPTVVLPPPKPAGVDGSYGAARPAADGAGEDEGAATTTPPPAELPKNSLHVLVVAGRSLAVKDKAWIFSTGPGTSDPFVTLTVGPHSAKTAVKFKDLNPKWNEAFSFSVTDPALTLTLSVDDYDLTSGNDFIGQAKIALSKELSSGAEYRAWLPLTTQSGTDDPQAGDLLVACRWVHDAAVFAAAAEGRERKAKAAVERKLPDGDDQVLLIKGLPQLPATDAQVQGKAPNELHVLVVKGRDLEPMDGKGMLAGLKDLGLSLPSISLPSISLPLPVPSLGGLFGKKKTEEAASSAEEKKEEAVAAFEAAPSADTKPTGPTSDPFVVVSVGDKSEKTSVVPKCLDPVWSKDNYFRFNVTDPGADVNLEVRDSDLLTSDFMGKLSIPMSKLADRSEHRNWHHLVDKSGIADKDRGRILVALRWVYNPSLMTEAEAMDNTDLGPPMKIKDGLENKAPNRLHIFVVRARKLRVMDKNLFSSGGSSDPMVKLVYDDEVKKTKVVRKSLTPVWMEKFHFDRVFSTSSKNCVEVILEDWDLAGGNDFMGSVKIPLISLKDRLEKRAWFSLGNAKGTTDGIDYGEILLGLHWVYDPKAKPPNDAKSSIDADLAVQTPQKNNALPPVVESKPEKLSAPVPPPPVVVDSFGEWDELLDPTTQRHYFYNKKTRVSCWAEPRPVAEERRRRTILKVQNYAKKSLSECEDTAYTTHRLQVQGERDKVFHVLSHNARWEMQRIAMNLFVALLSSKERSIYKSAWRTWMDLVNDVKSGEQSGAALEIQRVGRSYLLRKSQAATERGIHLHYISLRARASALKVKERDYLIATGQYFPVAGEMALEKMIEEKIDILIDESVTLASEDIVRQMELDEKEEARRLKERNIDELVDAAFDTSDEEDSDVEKAPKPIPESALDKAMRKYKEADMIKRGLIEAPPTVVWRTITNEDIEEAAAKIEDNILTNALDGVIEEVESYLGAAFALEPKAKATLFQDCVRLWANDETLTILSYLNPASAVARKDEKEKKGERERKRAAKAATAPPPPMRRSSSVKKFSEQGRSAEFDDDSSSDDEDAAEMNMGFGDAGAVALADAMRDNVHVRQLRVANNSVGDMGVSVLAKSMTRHPKLETVVLNNNNICDVGAAAIARLMVDNSKISLFDLRGNLIGDIGTRTIMRALRLNEAVENRKVKLGKNRSDVRDALLSRKLPLTRKAQATLPGKLVKVQYLEWV